MKLLQHSRGECLRQRLWWHSAQAARAPATDLLSLGRTISVEPCLSLESSGSLLLRRSSFSKAQVGFNSAFSFLCLLSVRYVPTVPSYFHRLEIMSKNTYKPPERMPLWYYSWFDLWIPILTKDFIKLKTLRNLSFKVKILNHFFRKSVPVSLLQVNLWKSTASV